MKHRPRKKVVIRTPFPTIKEMAKQMKVINKRLKEIEELMWRIFRNTNRT